MDLLAQVEYSIYKCIITCKYDGLSFLMLRSCPLYLHMGSGFSSTEPPCYAAIVDQNKQTSGDRLLYFKCGSMN